MTNDQRLALVTAMADKHAKANTASQSAAKKVLIREGFYTKEGKLSPNYGGLNTKPRGKAAEPS